MARTSPLLYDVKRGFKAALYEDAAFAVKTAFTGGENFANSTKNKWWQNAKAICENMRGYGIDTATFQNAVSYAKKKNLLTDTDLRV